MYLCCFFSHQMPRNHSYINNQVVRSIEDIRTVDIDFYIVKKTFLELLPGLIICLIASYFSLEKLKIHIMKKKIILLLTLSGVIPIMLSMKQSGFYIVTTLPFFSSTMGILIARIYIY